MHELTDVPLSDLLDPWELLRRIDKRGVQYLEMKESVAENGVLNAVLVRPKGDKYELVDGFVRTSVSRELGRKTIPAIVRDLSDQEVLVLQLQANACGIETNRIEYARRIRKLLDMNDGWTVTDASMALKKSPSWVKDQLFLLNLTDDIQKLVDRSELTLGNAYWLARLPHGAQEKLLHEALTLTNSEFAKLAGSKVKFYREVRAANKLTEAHEDYRPKPYLRSLTRIREESVQPVIASVVCEVENAKTPVDGFVAALMWVMQIDKSSVRGRQRRIAEKRKPPIIKEEQ